jgi:hypothetical protein
MWAEKLAPLRNCALSFKWGRRPCAPFFHSAGENRQRHKAVCAGALAVALTLTAHCASAAATCVSGTAEAEAAKYQQAFDDLLSDFQKHNWKAVGDTCSSCAKGNYYYRYVCAVLAYEMYPRNSKEFLAQIPTEQDGVKALFSLDEDVLHGGEPSSGLFNRTYYQGFFELFIAKLFPLAYGGNDQAVESLFRFFSLADGEVAEDLADRAYQLFREKPDVVLKNWQGIKDYIPGGSLESTELPRERQAVLQKYNSLCSKHPNFAQACPEVIKLLSSDKRSVDATPASAKTAATTRAP